MINDVRVRGAHGVYDDERATGNEFSIDLELGGHFEAAIRTDDISQSVDVDRVVALVRNVNERSTFNLIESFANALGQAVLQQFPLLEHVVVRVTKLTLHRLEAVRSATAEVTLRRS